MDKLNHDVLSGAKTNDELFEEIATGPFVSFPDTANEPTEQHHCNLRKEPWQYLEKLTKPAVNFNTQNLKQNVTQVKDAGVENTNSGREM